MTIVLNYGNRERVTYHLSKIRKDKKGRKWANATRVNSSGQREELTGIDVASLLNSRFIENE